VESPQHVHRAEENDRTAVRDRYNCEMQATVNTVSAFTEV